MTSNKIQIKSSRMLFKVQIAPTDSNRNKTIMLKFFFLLFVYQAAKFLKHTWKYYFKNKCICNDSCYIRRNFLILIIKQIMIPSYKHSTKDKKKKNEKKKKKNKKKKKKDKNKKEKRKYVRRREKF